MRRAPNTAQARDELELARRCADGDREAQGAVFRLLRRPIHRTLFRILGPSRHLLDLTQDTFLEVFRCIHTFRGSCRLATWAETIAARAAFRFLASRPPVHLSVVPDIADEHPPPEAQLDAREAIRRLYLILDRLEPKYRITYALHVIDGRSLRDVAVATETTYVAAKNRSARARRMVSERARRDPLLRRFLESGDESP